LNLLYHTASRVILPITDPYVVHHGALGGFATAYIAGFHDDVKAAKDEGGVVSDEQHKAAIAAAMKHLRACNGVYTVMSRVEAARSLDLPADRIGDIVVIGDQSTAIGRTPAYHDLSAVGNLRTHGALEEQIVPLMVSAPLAATHAKRLGRGKARNYELFDFLCNGVDADVDSAAH
jgi:phosphonoacetate hydrolase